MMQTLVEITIVVLLLLQTLSGASAVPEEALLLPVGERVSRNVVCEKVGRIPDYESTDCKTYYVCTPNTQGVLISILSQCPTSTLFSFEQLKCVSSADYSCPITTIEVEQTTTTIPSSTTTTTTTTSAPEPAFICPAAGRFANPQSFDCGSYYLCTRNTDGSLIAVVVTCPGTSVFDPDLASCVLAPHFCAQTTVPTTEATTVTPGSTVSDGFVCPDEGRYADTESSDCSRYYLCLKSGSTIVPNPAVCPLSTIFSPIVSQCVDKSTYVCSKQTPAPTTTPTIPTTTTSKPEVTTEVTTPPTEPQTITVVIPTTPTPRPVTTTAAPTQPTIPIEIPTTTTSRPEVTTEVSTPSTEPQTITVVIPTTPTPRPVTTTEVPTQPTIPIEIPTTTTSNPEVTTEVTTPPTEPQTITVVIPTTPTPRPVTTTEVPTQPTIPIEIPTTTTSRPEVTTEVTTLSTESQTITVVIPTTTTATEVTTTTEEEVTSTTSVEVTTSEIDTTPETTSASTVEATSSETTTTDAATTEITEQPTETEPTLTTEASSETTVTDTFETTTEFPNSTTEQTEEVTSTDTPATTDVESTTESETTSEEPTTTTEPANTVPSTTTDASPDSFICPAEGRYPDPNAIACESYILCIINTLGALSPLTFQCPPTTIFSLLMKMCVPATTYNCGTTPTDSTPPAATSTVPTTTESGTFVTPKPFVCPAPGRYIDPESIYCKSYYLCFYNAFGILDAVELSCPAGSIFASEVARCEPETEYKCITSPTTTTTETSISVTTITTTTTVTPSPTTTKGPFQCTESGRFVNPDITDCTNYKYCISVEGGFAQYTFTCPSDARFDPETRVCSDSYVCPSDRKPFVCTEPGKFVNQDRNDCKSYKYCIAMVDGFTQYTFSCPNGSLFDPNTRLCSATYVCPLV